MHTGDSIVRQLFVLLVADQRGLAPAVDHHFHKDALYPLSQRNLDADRNCGKGNVMGFLKSVKASLASTMSSASGTMSSRSRRSSKPDLVEFRIQPEEVKLVRKIGEGGFGEVYIATYAKRQVVAKKVKVEALGQEAAMRGIEDELAVAVRLRNPCVVQVFGAVFSGEHLLLVMELCSQGSVRAKLDEKPRCTLSRDARLLILGQVAEGCKYLTARGIVHRDIKADNVLLDSGGHAKLADFGISRVLDDDDTEADVAGTIPFMAPELFKKSAGKGSAYSDKSDVYAFGGLCIEVLGGGSPWRGEVSSAAQLVSAVQQGRQPALPANLPPQLAALVRACLAADRASRPTFDKVVLALDSYDPSDGDWQPGAASDEEQLEAAKQALLAMLEMTLREEAEAKQPLWPNSTIQRGSHVRVVGASLGAGAVTMGDIGVVQKRDDDGDYVVDFLAQDGWVGRAADLVLDETAERVRPGARCSLKPHVKEPRFGMGMVQPGSVGLVVEVTHDGIAKLNFGHDPNGKPGESLWAAPLAELVAVTHGGTWLGALQCGQAVRVRRDLSEPSTGWAAVTATSVGYVRAWALVASTPVYVVDFPEQDGWKGRDTDLEVDPVADAVRPGSRVRVRADVESPQFGWGGLTHAHVGVVQSVSHDGAKVRVRFAEHNGWLARLSDLEALPPAGLVEVLSSVLLAPFGACVQTPAAPAAPTPQPQVEPTPAPTVPARARAAGKPPSIAGRRFKKAITAGRLAASVRK
ncbi:hypothetical protein KFE25_010716 [Diacronema lutheri]|uniref:Protein kinase domain-containing protein n=2 Tax=Diacronema lutheri TaxID=2081491 RepID=A0A8J5XDX6_DIALT|nr:hypothetical protein KFE25_010716 [Diacronema lutheri]